MSDEQKKDMTNVLEFAKRLEESGQAPKVPEGSVMEEQTIEKIELFESLDDYAKSLPAPTIEMPAPETPPADEFPPTPQESPPAGLDIGDFPVTPSGDFSGALTGLSGATSASAEPSPPLVEAPISLSPPEPEPEFILEPPPEPLPSLPPKVSEPKSPPPPLPEKPALSPAETLQGVKEYSERMAVGRPEVAAAYPFSLMITGTLTPQEREKLLDLLDRHPMGIHERDLEPQFESGRILLPRISEYAAIVVLQAMRSASVSMRFGPSDSIFATEDTRESHDDPMLVSTELAHAVGTAARTAAEELPITPLPALPGLPRYTVVDVVTASAAIKTLVVEAKSSIEYQDTLEALQREIKFKAYRKGAIAILNFSAQLSTLSLPSHYRLTVVGSAVRTPNSET